MRKHALINNNTVVFIERLDESDFLEKAKHFQAVVDIEDMGVEPQVGWILDGNKLKHSNSLNQEQLEDLRMRARFKVGNKICDDAVILISSRNKMLGKTSAEVSQIISIFTPIEMAMRKCALPTALGGINQMKSNFPEYVDIFDYVIAELSNYLNSEG